MAIQDITTGKLAGQELANKNPMWKGDKAKSRFIHGLKITFLLLKRVRCAIDQMTVQ
jgi:hypothetical protein